MRNFILIFVVICGVTCGEVNNTKRVFDWQKDPEFSKENDKSSSSESDEIVPEPLSIIDVILAKNKSDVLVALQPTKKELKHQKVAVKEVEKPAEVVELEQKLESANVTKLSLVSQEKQEKNLNRKKRTLSDEQIERIFQLQRDAATSLLSFNKQVEVLAKNFRDFSSNLLTLPSAFTTSAPLFPLEIRPIFNGQPLFRKKRQISPTPRSFRLDVETIENLQSMLELLKTMASRWNNVNERVSRLRVYMQNLMGLPITPVQFSQNFQDRCSNVQAKYVDNEENDESDS